jgi:hypothetical protein
MKFTGIEHNGYAHSLHICRIKKNPCQRVCRRYGALYPKVVTHGFWRAGRNHGGTAANLRYLNIAFTPPTHPSENSISSKFLLQRKPIDHLYISNNRLPALQDVSFSRLHNGTHGRSPISFPLKHIRPQGLLRLR